MLSLQFRFFPSPLGMLLLGEISSKLCFCSWYDSKSPSYLFHLQDKLQHILHQNFFLEECNTPLLHETTQQLADYFLGRLYSFSLPLLPLGTPFQIRAWEILNTIPYGATYTYAEQAKRMGCPKATRAVGQANHCNPLAIIIPCHRVIGSNRTLTGYGGGVEIKRALLDLEMHYAV